MRDGDRGKDHVEEHAGDGAGDGVNQPQPGELSIMPV